MDLKGPEVRLGTFNGSDYEKVEVDQGQKFLLVTDENQRAQGTKDQAFIDLPTLPQKVITSLHFSDRALILSC